MNHEVIDCGTNDNERTHYPIFGHKVGVLVVTNKVDKGIVLCGTGVGIANSVNKIKGVRCALVREPLIAQKAVSDFDINVIAFGGWINGIGLIEEIVTTFVNAKYENKNKDIIKTINDLIVNENYQDDI